MMCAVSWASGHIVSRVGGCQSWDVVVVASSVGLEVVRAWVVLVRVCEVLWGSSRIVSIAGGCKVISVVRFVVWTSVAVWLAV